MKGRMVCPDCGEILRVVKNGIIVKMRWYNGYFSADLYECPVCGKQVISGFGDEFFGNIKDVDYDFTEGDGNGAE